LNDEAKNRREAPVVIARPDHNVSRANISKNALKVLYRLKDGGFKAFIVGGGVRDLLLGREPKDFDVATDAHPEDVRALFRNCRLIGRRFRLAHVHFGREIIEVATFRGSPDEEVEDPEDRRTLVDDTGRILRDNVYGDIDDDVWRRDFTANALYYNIADYSIWDYTGGVEDVHRGVMRLIGDPEARYREDPVRMLRAVRFAAKLGFRIEPATEAPISELGGLLADMPPARLYEEAQKLFLSGHAVASYELLRHYRLFHHLFPSASAELDREGSDVARTLFLAALENTDERVAADQPVSPMFLFGVFLWPAVSRLAARLREAGDAPIPALMEAFDTLVRAQQDHISIPRRHSSPMKDMMVMQLRFQRQKGRRALRVLDHPRFRAGYDLLRLRVAAGDESPEVEQFWTELQGTDGEHRRSTVNQEQRPRRRRRRPNRRRRKPGPKD
jgi:poly(A) polymerase